MRTSLFIVFLLFSDLAHRRPDADRLALGANSTMMILFVQTLFRIRGSQSFDAACNRPWDALHASRSCGLRANTTAKMLHQEPALSTCNLPARHRGNFVTLTNRRRWVKIQHPLHVPDGRNLSWLVFASGSSRERG
jgi:hypothetical protein